MKVLDDFAGPGGWDEGLKMLGVADVTGVEWDDAACKTAEAAGHTRIKHDVTTHKFDGIVDLYIASPSCTLFSQAGHGTGRQALDVLADGIRRMFAGEDCREEVREATYREFTLPDRTAKNAARPTEKRWTDEKVEQAARTDAFIAALVLEPARRIVEHRPPRIAMEQVPSVLPLWQVYADCLRALGYYVWCGVLMAADYGVPQTRERAILMASTLAPVFPPEPTHSKAGDDGDLFGTARAKWVSLGEALGWDDSLAVRPKRGEGLTERHGERPDNPASEPAPTVISNSRSWEIVAAGVTGAGRPRSSDQPAPTLTSKGTAYRTTAESQAAAERGQWEPKDGERPPVYVNGNQPNASRRSVDEPAPTVLFGHRSNDVRWVFERPSTTIVGPERPDVVAAPGYRTEVSRQDAPGSVRVTAQEAGVLQSFPVDYPWQGSRSKQYEQVGNAVPPLLAAHICAALGLGELNQEAAA